MLILQECCGKSAAYGSCFKKFPGALHSLFYLLGKGHIGKNTCNSGLVNFGAFRQVSLLIDVLAQFKLLQDFALQDSCKQFYQHEN